MGKLALQAWRDRQAAPKPQARPRANRPPPRDWLYVVPLEEPADACRPREKIRQSNWGRTNLHDQIERLWVDNDRLKGEVARLEILLRRGTAYVLDQVARVIDGAR